MPTWMRSATQEGRTWALASAYDGSCAKGYQQTPFSNPCELDRRVQRCMYHGQHDECTGENRIETH